MPDPRPQLHVCVTCRAGRTLAEDEPTPGQVLHDAVARLMHAGAPVTLHAVSCLASCDRGCTAAMLAPGKWGYLLGHLRTEHAGDLLEYGVAFAAARTGAVMPSRRPASLAGTVLGRVPALAGDAA